VAAFALTIAFGMLLGLTLAAGALVTHSKAAFDALGAQLREEHPGANPIGFLAANGFEFGLVLGSFALAAFLVQRKRPVDIIGAWSWTLFARGLAIWLALGLLLGGLVDYALAPHGFSITATSATWALAVTAVVALSVQTFAEEFMFRGWLTQGLLLATRRAPVAAVLSGILFGSLHIPNGAPQAVAAAAFGIAMSLIAIRTGGIAFSFGVHLVNNVFGAFAVVSSDDVFKGLPAIVTQRTPQLAWFDVAFECAVLAVVVWLVLRVRASSATLEPAGS
jgi:membrane protease YdiL (CAAX protease family)